MLFFRVTIFSWYELSTKIFLQRKILTKARSSVYEYTGMNKKINGVREVQLCSRLPRLRGHNMGSYC